MKNLIFALAFFSIVFTFSVSHAEAATLYFNGAIDNDWNTLGNWWTDSGFSSHANNLPGVSDDVVVSTGHTVYTNSGSEPTINTLVVNGNSVIEINISVVAGVIFNTNSTCYGTITGNVTFNDQSRFYCMVNGNVFLNTTLYNGNTPIEGTITIDNQMWEGQATGTIYGSDEIPITQYIFNGNGSNSSSGIEGSVVFNNTSNNNGVVNGNVIFNGSSCNARTINGDVIFNGTSANHCNWESDVLGTINGNATFKDTSNNGGTVTSNACFASTATNNGTVNGRIVCPVNAPTSSHHHTTGSSQSRLSQAQLAQIFGLPTTPALPPLLNQGGDTTATVGQGGGNSVCSIIHTLKLYSIYGDEVKCLQILLNITSDGKFGPKTERAVTDFQKLHNLTPDGAVGPLTRKALGL